MSTTLDNAKEMLLEGDFTCVVSNDEMTYTSTMKGISPWIKWLEEGKKFEGYSVADRIIGKAAALLLVLGKVKEVYALVMSLDAIEVLENNNIDYFYDRKVEKIINRDGTDICPMEKAVKNIKDPKIALGALKETLENLKRQQQQQQ